MQQREHSSNNSIVAVAVVLVLIAIAVETVIVEIQFPFSTLESQIQKLFKKMIPNFAWTKSEPKNSKLVINDRLDEYRE